MDPQSNLNPIPNKLNVLVVDNHRETTETFRAILEKQYTIHIARRSAQAYEILKSTTVHIILCADVLPDISGAKFLAQAKDKYPSAIRILSSSQGDSIGIVEAINQANIFKFVTKPWGPKLLETVNEAEALYIKQSENQLRDTATGLSSPTAIMDVFHSEINRYERYHTELSIMLINIHNPKADSEIHSYLVEQLLVRKIASLLSKTLRDSDTAGRLSSTTFLALLTQTGSEGTIAFHRRFMAEINLFEQEENRGLLPFELMTSSISLGNQSEMTESDIIDQLYDTLERTH